MRFFLQAAAFLLAISALVGCASAATTPTPSPVVPTPTFTRTPLPPTSTSTPPPPTATPVPPTATWPPIPTADFAPEEVLGIWTRSDPYAGDLFITLLEGGAYTAAHGSPEGIVHTGRYRLDGRLFTFVAPGWSNCTDQDAHYTLRLMNGEFLFFDLLSDPCTTRATDLRSRRWARHTPAP